MINKLNKHIKSFHMTFTNIYSCGLSLLSPRLHSPYYFYFSP